MARHRYATVNYQSLILETLKEKYPYLILGITVILILYLTVASLFTGTGTTSVDKDAGSKIEQQVKETEKAVKEQLKKYVVKAGDHLWKIAEETYGSGYNAYDIAVANNIANPSYIEVGQILMLPTVTPKIPTRGEVAAATVSASTSQVIFTDNKYTVKDGDCLWNIALQAYGDGFAWVKIAQANQLPNPSLILPDTELAVPRN
jgi:nucleoid-associated protein YgaU